MGLFSVVTNIGDLIYSVVFFAEPWPAISYDSFV